MVTNLLYNLKVYKRYDEYISEETTYTAFPCLYSPFFTNPKSPFPRSSFSTIESELKISSGLSQFATFEFLVRDPS